MQVSNFLVRGLYARLVGRGDAAQAFLTAAGLTEAQLAQSRSFADLAAVLRAVRFVGRLTGEPISGLEVAAEAPLKTLGAIGALLTNSPTLRQALSELETYFGLFSRAGAVRCAEAEGTACVTLKVSAAEAAQDPLVTDYLLALIVRIAREVLGHEVAPLWVELPYAPPRDASAYAAFYRCPLRFGAAQASVAFASELLDRPAPIADEAWWTMLKAQVEASLVPTLPRVPMHRRVSLLLKEDFPLQEANRKTVAKRLGITVRTLLRQLNKEDKSFFKLVDEARRDAAARLLVETEDPLKSIADQLGFSEPSAFHRAFKRWTGETPHRYKARHRVGLALAS